MYYRVTFPDPTGPFAPGRATVFVEAVGRGSVRIRDPYTGHAGSITRATWNALYQSANEISRPRNVKPRCRQYRQAHGLPITPQIATMLEHPGRRL